MTTLIVAGRVDFMQAMQPSLSPYPGISIIPVLPTTQVLDFPAFYMAAAYVKEVRSPVSGLPCAKSYGSQIRFAQGVVKEGGVVVSRRVCAYNRETKQLLASTMSDQAGKFYLTWAGYAGKFFVLVFDDETDSADYNCQVYDLLDSIY